MLDNRLVWDVEAETFGQRLRRLRTEKGWSQDTLGKMAGLTGQSLYLIETGRRTRMQADTIKRVAESLGVTPLFLEYGFDQLPSGAQLPPLEVYLREAFSLNGEQVAHVRRTVLSMERERQLRELRAQYAAQDAKTDEDEEQLAAYDRPELAEAARRDAEEFDPA